MNCCKFNLIIVQQDATYSVYYISVGSSTCFSGVDTHHQELVQLQLQLLVLINCNE